MLWACFQFDADLIGVHSKNQAITDWVLRVVSAEHAVLLFSERPTGFQSGHFPHRNVLAPVRTTHAVQRHRIFRDGS